MRKLLLLLSMAIGAPLVNAEIIVSNIDVNLLGGTTNIYSDSAVLLGKCGPMSAHNVVVSPNGQLFIGDHFGGFVYRQQAAGSPGTLFGGPGSFRGAAGMVFDRNGNLFLSDYGSNRIFKIDPNGNSAVFAASVAGPNHMVIHNGNLWVTCAKNNLIRRFDLNNSENFVDYPTGLDFPVGIDFDSANNFYVSSYSQGIVRRINIDNFMVVDVASGLIQPHGVTVGPDGMLYIAESGRNRVIRVGLNGGAFTEFLTGLTTPIDIKFGNLKKFVYKADLNRHG